jgi:predicted MFS family arabinose efflux permease
VTALALIGLFNIVGTYAAGWLGSRMPRKYILSGIYFLRSVVIALFVWLPLSPLRSMRSRSRWACCGCPPSADQQRRRGDLRRPLPCDAGRFTFFSHQIGSFLGAWLGGLVFDRTGS